MSGSLLQVQRGNFTHVITFGDNSIHWKIKPLGYSIHVVTTAFRSSCQVCYLGSNNSRWYNVTQRAFDLPWGSL